jgi:hypothetical protein
MKTLKTIYETAFKEFLEHRYTLKIIDASYTPLNDITEYVKNESDAITYAKISMVYEWYLDNNCFEVIQDIIPFVLLPETPIELQEINFTDLVYSISPETRKVMTKK